MPCYPTPGTRDTPRTDTMPHARHVRFEVVSQQRTYAVIVGAGILGDLADHLRLAGLADPTVVTVAPVWRHQGHRVAAITGDRGPVLMSDGERAKTPRTVSRLYDAF